MSISLSSLCKLSHPVSQYVDKSLKGLVRGGVGRFFSASTSYAPYIAPTEGLRAIARNHMRGLNPYRESELPVFLKVAALAAHTFPSELRDQLYDFKQHGNSRGYVLIRSLPEDPDLMDTPEKLKSVAEVKKTFFSEFWLSSIGSLVGELFGYIQENNGNLYHNVRPEPSKANVLSSESSSLYLDLHTETAFHPFCPDFLSLHCLRSDRTGKAATVVSSLRAVQEHISPELNKLLRQPLFQTGIDYSFGNINEVRGNGPIIPVLRGDPSDPLLIFDPDLMVGLTDDANQALKTLKRLFDDKREPVFLQQGDLLIIDNYRALHGRTPFKAFYDGKDRWLQRVYITRDLMKASQLFNDRRRIVHYSFAHYFKERSH